MDISSALLAKAKPDFSIPFFPEKIPVEMTAREDFPKNKDRNRFMNSNIDFSPFSHTISTMLARVFSASNIGLNSEKIEMESDLSRGLPSFTIVGLGDAAVQESRERVRSAVKNSGFEFPLKKITVNLAPADIRKSGPSFDLAIAIGILLSTMQVDQSDILADSLFIGELALNGKLRHISGVLPIASFAQKNGFKRIFLPEIDAEEAGLIEGIEVYGAKNLREVASHIMGDELISLSPPTDFESILSEEKYSEDFSYIKGQEHAKRALEIAASGGHNLLMNGAPGAGKTLMARAFRTILPKLTRDESFETSEIYSVANLLPSGKPLVSVRPFRVVHHTASAVAIVGGGNPPRPGEISLAHKGVLFLDELSEFPSNVLEVLRQPLEDREITISRAHGSVLFPADFTLIAAMNPCPCGYNGVLDSTKECTCSSANIERYKKRISGPLLDRIDLFVDISPVKFDKLSSREEGEKSVDIRKRVQEARNSQEKRLEKENICTNSEMNVRQVEKHCPIEPDAHELLEKAVHQFNLSARGYHKTLKVARTIADLDGKNEISIEMIAEALQFRRREN